ncbi:hypothetical protein AHF37_09214 [Paragonimus kellicotti]|nr:hypothetical protein AHF37_09214 [Paragonimus kellicotti]
MYRLLQSRQEADFLFLFCFRLVLFKSNPILPSIALDLEDKRKSRHLARMAWSCVGLSYVRSDPVCRRRSGMSRTILASDGGRSKV